MNTTEQVPKILCKFVRDNKDFPKTEYNQSKADSSCENYHVKFQLSKYNTRNLGKYAYQQFIAQIKVFSQQCVQYI